MSQTCSVVVVVGVGMGMGMGMGMVVAKWAVSGLVPCRRWWVVGGWRRLCAPCKLYFVKINVKYKIVHPCRGLISVDSVESSVKNKGKIRARARQGYVL